MFGISSWEFLVILIIAIAVVPAKDWPKVVKFFSKAVRYVKNIIGQIQDGIEDIENEITKDLPVDKLSQKTMDDMIDAFSSPVKQRTRRKCKK